MFLAPLYIDDLENIVDENMVLSFNTEIEDGSIEEVFCFSVIIFTFHFYCLVTWNLMLRRKFLCVDVLSSESSLKSIIPIDASCGQYPTPNSASKKPHLCAI